MKQKNPGKKENCVCAFQRHSRATLAHYRDTRLALITLHFSKRWYGSLDIAATQNCTHYLKIGFMVAGGGFYSYYIHQRE